MALPNFATADRVLQRIAHALSKDVTKLEPVWAARADQGIADATSKIFRTLGAKGYTLAQMADDPGIGSLCTRLAACYAMVEAGPSGGYTEAVERSLERYEKELAEWPVMTQETQAAGGQVVFGGMLAGWEAEQERFRRM